MRFIGRLPPEECQETSLTGAHLRLKGRNSTLKGFHSRGLLATLGILTLVSIPAHTATNAPSSSNAEPAQGPTKQVERRVIEFFSQRTGASSG